MSMRMDFSTDVIIPFNTRAGRDISLVTILRFLELAWSLEHPPDSDFTWGKIWDFFKACVLNEFGHFINCEANTSNF